MISPLPVPAENAQGLKGCALVEPVQRVPLKIQTKKSVLQF